MSKEKLNTAIQNESKIELKHQHHNNKTVGRKIYEAFKANITKKMEPWKQYVNTLSDKDILDGNFDKSKLTRTAADFHLDYTLYPFLRRHTEHAPTKEGLKDVPKNIDYIGYTYTRYTGDIINQICGRYEVETNFEEPKGSRERVKNQLTMSFIWISLVAQCRI